MYIDITFILNLFINTAKYKKIEMQTYIVKNAILTMKKKILVAKRHIDVSVDVR